MRYTWIGAALGFVSPGTLLAQPVTITDSAPAGAADRGQAEEIFVTARKREESVQDVPIAITLLSKHDIEQSSAIRISDALATVPNVYFSTDSLGGSEINIRGISSSTNNLGFESAVGVYVDEVYLARPNVFDQGAVDIERIEVLRGPQGTLFGRNTTAGVLNIATTDPSKELEGGFDATYGRYDLRQLRGTVSAPLGDTFGFRLSGSLVKRDGWFRQETPGFHDFFNQDTRSIRAKLRADPSAGFSIVATLDYSRDKSVSGNNKVIAGPLLAFDPFPGDRIATNVDGKESRTFWMGSLRMNADVSTFRMTSITAFQSIRYDRFNDQDYTIVDVLSTGAPEKDKFFSQELRLTSQAEGPFSYILGGYFSDATVDGSTRAVLGSDTPIALGLGAIPGYQESEQTDARIRSSSIAGFGSFTYNLGDQVTVSAGLRYTYERKRLNYQQTVYPFELAPGVPVGIIFAFADNVAPTRQKYNDAALSGDASLTYNWSKRVSSYFRFSRGYKAGGFDSTTSASSDPGALAFGPETVDLYELGFKSVLAGGSIRFNAAAFHISYQDKQEQNFNGVNFLTSNAASAKVDGIEGEVSLRLAKGLSVNLNLGYADARYKSFVDILGGTDFSGNRLADSAKWTGGANADYTASIGNDIQLSLHGEASVRSRAYTSSDNDPRFATEGFIVVNVRAGLEFENGKYGLFAWGRNVTNKRYILGGFDFLGSTFVTPNMPASWGVEARARF